MSKITETIPGIMPPHLQQTIKDIPHSRHLISFWRRRNRWPLECEGSADPSPSPPHPGRGSYWDTLTSSLNAASLWNEGPSLRCESRNVNFNFFISHSLIVFLQLCRQNPAFRQFFLRIWWFSANPMKSSQKTTYPLGKGSRLTK